MKEKIIKKYYTYLSSFSVLLLWISISLQLLFLCASSYEIKVPNYISNKLLSAITKSYPSLNIDNITILDFKKLKIGQLEWEGNGTSVVADNLVISADYDPKKFKFKYKLTIEKLLIEHNENFLTASSTSLELKKNYLHSRAKISISDKLFESSVVVDRKFIAGDSNRNDLNLGEKLNYIFDSLAYCSDSHFKLYGLLSNKIDIHLASGNKSESKTNQVLHFSTSSDPRNHKNIALNLRSNSNAFAISSSMVKTKGFSIIFNACIDQNNHLQKITEAVLSFDSVFLEGPVTGEIPEMIISVHSNEENQTILNSFCDSSGHEISLITKIVPHPDLRGFMRLKPSNISLHAAMPYGMTRIVNGDELNLSFRHHQNADQNKTLCHFNFSANDFSALGTPAGNFNFNGEIKSNFSIFVTNAIGEFGASKAVGLYEQHWNPMNYKFTLEGNCLPTDINPWLGLWWSKLWDDFSFGTQSPYGKFSISGIWNGPPGNCVTNGLIRGKDISYRNLRFSDSTINLNVKDSYTTLICNNLTHDQGTLSGSLIFSPKAHTAPHLTFQVKGQYPLNEGKALFDPDTANALAEINASVIDAEGQGIVYYESSDPISEQNDTAFSISLNCKQETFYKKIPIQSFSGNLIRKDGLLSLNFPALNIAEGQGTLFAEEISKSSNLVNLNLKLDSASYSKLSNLIDQHILGASDNLGNSPVSEIQSAKKPGKVNLNFSGTGPSDNLLQFEGTGMISLDEIDVGSMNILGGIRKNLGRFNLPLPSDALRFDSLEIPFRLENESLLFDNFELEGPISRITGAGKCDITDQIIEINADLQLLGGVNIPVVKQLISLADPIAKLTQINITGPINEPDWVIQIVPINQADE